MTWAVLPLKPAAEAKRRLAGELSEGQRAGLTRAMAFDVLAAMRRVAGLGGVLVVTADEMLADLAQAFGARVLPEPAADGYNAAVARAAALLAGEGVGAMLCIPGDVPLASAAEIGRVAAALAGAPAAALVPDSEREGTNALGLAPPTLIEPRFGAGSFAAHRAALEAAGAAPTILDLPGLALDIDSVDDLKAFAARAGAGETRAYLASAGLLGRLSAA